MDYAEANDFFSSRSRKAAKLHDCCECGQEIAVGTHYEYASGKSDGVIFTQRTCLPCAEIRDTFACYGYVFTMLWESVRESLFPRWPQNLYGVECLAKLKTDAAVAKMRAMYAEWEADNNEDAAND